MTENKDDDGDDVSNDNGDEGSCGCFVHRVQSATSSKQSQQQQQHVGGSTTATMDGATTATMGGAQEQDGAQWTPGGHVGRATAATMDGATTATLGGAHGGAARDSAVADGQCLRQTRGQAGTPQLRMTEALALLEPQRGWRVREKKSLYIEIDADCRHTK